jgi:hypothetical protein
MEIIIDDNTLLCDIQKDFISQFPYLKLEFFNFQPDHAVFNRKNLITDTKKTIGTVRHVHYKGHISINGHQKVKTLEQNFLEHYGINVQVFRKSGNVYLETLESDDWTLSEQNRKGSEMAFVEQAQDLKDIESSNDQE